MVLSSATALAADPVLVVPYQSVAREVRVSLYGAQYTVALANRHPLGARQRVTVARLHRKLDQRTTFGGARHGGASFWHRNETR